MEPGHPLIYQHARCYDIAFAFRDIAVECDTLEAIALRHLGRPVASVLELAAGPARHAREFARRGVSATALDNSAAMCAY
ncbi:MAG: class I SAM-dependent methyltransferase, partial [Solirubrobacteraceae bacterium]|nr:class I SAM-dependent methyltransferase [Solirubrobacteraceae bacterium]